MSALVAALGGATALGLLALAVLLWRKFGRRLSPEQQERLRRLLVDRQGRMSDATLIEVRDRVVYYRYQVGGMEYVASQDLKALAHLLPAELAGLSGHASVKYLPENPANSIVASERWCGLHRREASPGSRPGAK